MKLVAKYLSLAMLIITLGFFNSAAYAEASQQASEIIGHLNQALPFLQNGDVANATTHIKFARRVSNNMNGDSAELKKAKNTLFQVLKYSKQGAPEKSIEAIKEAIALFEKL